MSRMMSASRVFVYSGLGYVTAAVGGLSYPVIGWFLSQDANVDQYKWKSFFVNIIGFMGFCTVLLVFGVALIISGIYYGSIVQRFPKIARIFGPS
jgi:hypothetical protein